MKRVLIKFISAFSIITLIALPLCHAQSSYIPMCDTTNQHNTYTPGDDFLTFRYISTGPLGTFIAFKLQLDYFKWSFPIIFSFLAYFTKIPTIKIMACLYNDLFIGVSDETFWE